MSDSSDNSTMAEERARREPKRLKEIAMMKLIHMLIERLVPHILRSYQDIDFVGGFGAIREEILAIRNWIYEPLSCTVANDVQELMIKALPGLVDDERCLMYPNLKYLDLLVLHPKCRNLKSEFFWDDMIGDVIDMLQSLVCLEHIEWTRWMYKTDQFTTNLKYCARLKVFEHGSGCNDEIIKVLSENCPLLKELIVWHSKGVTDKSVHYIENMKSLKNCNIRDTSITMGGAASILKNCTQLHQLDMEYDTCEILDSFGDAEDPIKLSLTTVVYLYNYPGTPHLLKKYCPFLVERLTIVDFPCCYSALNTWLIFENINAITLRTDDVSGEDLVELSNMCQNITELYVQVYTVKSNMHSFSEHRPFQKLKMLRFDTGSNGPKRFREKDASIFKILLSYSTMVTHVSIQSLYIDDHTVETILKTNKMRYLQYWEMERTVCTANTFYLLFDTCPMLKFIGNLRTWEIHPDEAQEIESVIRQGNYNLDTDVSDPGALLIRYVDRAGELWSKMVLRM